MRGTRDGLSAGVFRYGAGRAPTSTYRSSNYYVDVVFSAHGRHRCEPDADTATPPLHGMRYPDPDRTPTPTPTAPTPTATASRLIRGRRRQRGLAWYQANTGVPAGTVLKASGSITVTTAGPSSTAWTSTGTITVNADNVTIRNTRVKGTHHQPRRTGLGTC